MSLAGDIAKLIGHSLHVGLRVAKDDYSRGNYRKYGKSYTEEANDLMADYKLHYDRELEEYFLEMIEDQERFDEVWDLLEQYKSSFIENRQSFEEKMISEGNEGYLGYTKRQCYNAGLNFVDGIRKPFRSKSGTLISSSTFETKELKHNRDSALFLLMQSKGKRPKIYYTEGFGR